jgi:hypothetical protein
MPERYARNEFGCIRFLQRWYADQGWWRGQPSSCRKRAAEFESVSSQIVTVWDLVVRRKAVEIEERERELSDPRIAFPMLPVKFASAAKSLTMPCRESSRRFAVGRNSTVEGEPRSSPTSDTNLGSRAHEITVASVNRLHAPIRPAE